MSRHQHYTPAPPAFSKPYSLFDLPPIPSGPPAPIPTKDEGTLAAYRTWRETDDGKRVWKWVVREALDALRRGELRVSPRTLGSRARDFFKVPVNDHFTCHLADDLVHGYPALQDVIERRKRKATP